MSMMPHDADTTVGAMLIGDMVRAYRPIVGAHDELKDRSGRVRPAWQGFINGFSGDTAEHAEARFRRADQYLRDAGVFYRAYGKDGSLEREWPLAHIPFLIDEGEWLSLTHGLRQRADLLETIAADLYGPCELVTKGLLPAAIIAQSRQYLRPMVGAKPGGGHFLTLVAFDLGRDPSGRWRVLNDRTQAPSGAGFALENRVATSRAFEDIYRTSAIHRVAGFFTALRDSLVDLTSPDGERRVAILTPGPANETYFEHAYLARYLGVPLLQGDDLVAEDGMLKVRTVCGLDPVDGLWRRIDGHYMDPLEFDHASLIGTPGLADVARAGGVRIANALGSGILEIRALSAFLPGLCRALRAESLAIPNIATWWCGDRDALDHVQANFDRMMIGPALSSLAPFEDDHETLVPGQIDIEQRTGILYRLNEQPALFVGQEAVTVSTIPVYAQGALLARPMILRVYAVRTHDGWTFMPGGMARVGSGADTRAIALRQGGLTADVWVVSQSPAPIRVQRPGDTAISQPVHCLPSRTGDNFFWLGRYIERSETLTRILRGYHGRLADLPDSHDPLLAAIRQCLWEFGVTTDPPVPEALRGSVISAVDSARRIRDRFSPDGWSALGDLEKTLSDFSMKLSPGRDTASAMSVILRKINGLTGLIHENMYRSNGWRFLDIGRRIERIIQTCHLLKHFLAEDGVSGSGDFLLDAADLVLTHRRVFRFSAGRATIVDLMAHDRDNPRSIRFQIMEIDSEIRRLPDNGRETLRRDLFKHLAELDALLTPVPGSETTAWTFFDCGQVCANLAQTLEATYLR